MRGSSVNPYPSVRLRVQKSSDWTSKYSVGHIETGPFVKSRRGLKCFKHISL